MQFVNDGRSEARRSSWLHCLHQCQYNAFVNYAKIDPSSRGGCSEVNSKNIISTGSKNTRRYMKSILVLSLDG